ncbi:MAG: hypothetical protein IPP47_12260 [Bryobacterales bacterium]|nr:hypothetical protein [Bryobacterales bacterium]
MSGDGRRAGVDSVGVVGSFGVWGFWKRCGRAAGGLGRGIKLLEFAQGAGYAVEDAAIEALDGLGGGMEGEGVEGARALPGEAPVEVGEDSVFDVAEMQVPGCEVGGFELEAAEEGVGGIGGDAAGLGDAVLVDGGGDGVFAGVGAVGAGVGGGGGFAGGRARSGGSLGVGVVGGELAGRDLDQRHTWWYLPRILYGVGGEW